MQWNLRIINWNLHQQLTRLGQLPSLCPLFPYRWPKVSTISVLIWPFYFIWQNKTADLVLNLIYDILEFFLNAANCNNLENLVNNYRRDIGLPILQCHDKPRYLAKIHVWDLRDADYNCGNLHAWRSNKWTHPHGACGGGAEYTCKIMAKHQGKAFVLKTYSTFEEISYGGKGSDRERFQGWKNSPGHDAIMRTTGSNIFGCYNNPDGEFSHCIFQKLGDPLSLCSAYL